MRFTKLGRVLALAAVPAAFALAATPASATLHGFCASANPCSDNGTNTPTGVNPPQFGFSAGGHSATGDTWIALLIPDNLAQPSSFTISGSLLGANTKTASLFSSSPWTSGQLDAFLGISASPTNPIGAYLPTTNYYQPGAGGFWVYKADLGTVTLPSNSGASDSALLTLNQSLGLGSYAVAFIHDGRNWDATANSGAILEDGGKPPPPGVPEPATWAMMITGFGAAGVALRRRKPKLQGLSQLA